MNQMSAQGVLRFSERRAAPRFPIRMPVRIRDREGRVTEAMAINISTGGMLIAPAQAHVAPGGELALDIGDVAHGVMARVAGHRKQGTGLQFVDAHEGERLALTLSELAQRSA
ncbi:PilZ domain-containing protein [Minwuia thermotolerans]|uniref:PilZ domain-containing protein n=1 Tax=Minwuia thermotolerans TaxID=2056226 RepID=A0A2M9G708_9PROT|nr:PilZ domain-containing protein [Minwuia thermotolerans]PJK31509.1 hypothetical protein CVT23_00175 [Minwuia thermotolerans]